jgi:hypothetical protein
MYNFELHAAPESIAGKTTGISQMNPGLPNFPKCGSQDAVYAAGVFGAFSASKSSLHPWATGLICDCGMVY